MTIDLYEMPASAPCRAVKMTARQIGVDVNVKSVNLMAGEQNKPEYLKMNPQHCVPTIDDNGFHLWESRAIQTYLVNKYAPDSDLYPRDPEKRALVDRLLYFDIGTLYRSLGEYLYPHLFQGKALEPEKEKTFHNALELLNTFLSENTFVAGPKLTIADLSIFAGLTFAESAGIEYSKFPKVNAWLAKLKGLLPYHEEINQIPLDQFKEALKSRK